MTSGEAHGGGFGRAAFGPAGMVVVRALVARWHEAVREADGLRDRLREAEAKLDWLARWNPPAARDLEWHAARGLVGQASPYGRQL